ncbi:MAG: hypothetical protein MAG453_01696 [Calditrichaeota bacterium]|nr:hypothetical protein [Calditrichota bacterium]
MMEPSENESGSAHREKMDRDLLQAAGYCDLAHWVAIFDLDPERSEREQGFVDWMRRCGVDAREMVEGGIVVRKPGRAFMYIPEESLADCETQYEQLKSHWAGEEDGTGPQAGNG